MWHERSFTPTTDRWFNSLTFYNQTNMQGKDEKSDFLEPLQKSVKMEEPGAPYLDHI